MVNRTNETLQNVLVELSTQVGLWGPVSVAKVLESGTATCSFV